MHTLDRDTREEALTQELRRSESHRSWFRRSKKKAEKENSHTVDDKIQHSRRPPSKPPVEPPKTEKQPEDSPALQQKVEHIMQENDALRDENTTFRYQIEILTDKVTELAEANRKLLFGASQMREEISCLHHDCAVLTSKNETLIQQLREMRQILIDAGVSPTFPCGNESNGVVARPHSPSLSDGPQRETNAITTANHKKL